MFAGLTLKPATNQLLAKLDNILTDYFNGNILQNGVLPTVQFPADKLLISPIYLSDMLRSLTGQSTQQHIHNKLIAKAKEILTTTDLSVSEIAYQSGFEHPQSFSKLFKSKTSFSPLEYKPSFNKKIACYYLLNLAGVYQRRPLMPGLRTELLHFFCGI